MDRLPGNAKRLGDLREGPARRQGTFNGGILDSIGETTQRADRRQCVGGIFREDGRSGNHASTFVDVPRVVNLS